MYNYYLVVFEEYVLLLVFLICYLNIGNIWLGNVFLKLWLDDIRFIFNLNYGCSVWIF